MSELRLLVDPDDDPHAMRLLLGAHSLAQGTAVASVTPGGRTAAAALVDVARALGKSATYGIPRASHAAKTEMLISWLRGENVRRLIVARAHLLEVDAWQYLADLARVAGVTLDLVMQGATPGRTRLTWLREQGLEAIPVTPEYLASLPRTQPDPAHTEPDFPPVPQTHFTTFLHDCRELMHGEELSPVEREYARCWHEADAALAEGDPWTMSRWVPLLLGRLLRGACRSRATVAIRATQAAFFHNGWLLRIDDERLASLLAEHNPPRLDETTATTLRGYLDPQRAAAAVTRTLVGDDARCLTINDLNPNATIIRGNDKDIDVPAAVQPLLRAHLELRHAEGADAISPLLRVHDHPRNHYADRFHNPDQWRELMRRLAADTGLNGLTAQAPTTRIEPHWNRANGFSLQRLSTT